VSVGKLTTAPLMAAVTTSVKDPCMGIFQIAVGI
jgi:hypothetical protein